RLLDQLPEAVEIEGAALDARHVAGCAGDERVAATECLTKLRHADAERGRACSRRLVAPELVDEPVARDDLVGAEKQHGEQPRCFSPPRGTGRPPSCSSSAPRMRNSTTLNTAVTKLLPARPNLQPMNSNVRSHRTAGILAVVSAAASLWTGT